MLMVQRSLTMELTNQGQGHPRNPPHFYKNVRSYLSGLEQNSKIHQSVNIYMRCINN